MDAERQRLVQPVMLYMFLLRSLGDSGGDCVVARGQHRHYEGKARFELPPRRHAQGLSGVNKMGIVAEDSLTEAVIDTKTDDRAE